LCLTGYGATDAILLNDSIAGFTIAGSITIRCFFVVILNQLLNNSIRIKISKFFVCTHI
jgi:hypothetical protein